MELCRRCKTMQTFLSGSLSLTCLSSFQGDGEPSLKLEFDDDSMADANGAGDGSLVSPSGMANPGAKPKTPRVKREKKEPGKMTSDPPPFVCDVVLSVKTRVSMIYQARPDRGRLRD